MEEGISVQACAGGIQNTSIQIPLVTILLCTNRNDALLHRAIDSCLRQTLVDFELVLIANGECAIEIASSISHQYRNEPRLRVDQTHVRHLNFSLALGVHLSRADFIARMDADDISVPDRLEIQLAYMRTNKDVAVLASGYELIDTQGTTLSQVIPATDSKSILRQLQYRNPLCHPSVMLRAAAVRQVGGYLGGNHAEDYDLWCRIAIDGRWRIAAMAEPLIRYNAVPTGEARRSRSAYVSMASVQLGCFLATGRPQWAIGSFVSACKCIWRGRSASSSKQLGAARRQSQASKA